MKRCRKCKQFKPSGFFYKWSRSCLACKRLAARTWYRKNSNRSKNTSRKWAKKHWALVQSYNRQLNRKTSYGLDSDTFDKMFKGQRQKCAICFKRLRDRGRGSDSVAVDHDHKASRVRGILCRDCNCGLGNFRDSVKLLKSAIVYIKRNKL